MEYIAQLVNPSTKQPRRRSGDRIRIGVSACLLGHEVRYDGGHKREAFLVNTLGRYVEWVPVCPEVEVGLGTPRPTLRLQRDGADVRLVMPKTGGDYTEAMRGYARSRVGQLAGEGLCGYIFKKDSPSCGMERVKVYGAHSVLARSGRGVFADVLMRRLPNLPVEEEGRLHDPQLRDNFIERVFAYRRLRTLVATRWTIGDLVAFHTAHKLQLLAHSPQSYRRLGRMVAGARATPRAALRDAYESEFMSALKIVATPRRHSNVLHHILGYFTTQLDADSRREVMALIDDYRSGRVPLVAPMTLLRHYVRRFDIAYLKGQVYLEPRAEELMLRSGA